MSATPHPSHRAPAALRSLCGNYKIGTSAAEQFAEKVERIAVSGGRPPTSVVISAQARLPVPPKPGFRRLFPQAVKPHWLCCIYVVAKATTYKASRVTTQTLRGVSLDVGHPPASSPHPTMTPSFSLDISW